MTKIITTQDLAAAAESDALMFEVKLARRITQKFEDGYFGGGILVRTAQSLHTEGGNKPGRGEKLAQIDVYKRVCQAVNEMKGFPNDAYLCINPHNRKFMKMAVRMGYMSDDASISWPVLEALKETLTEFPQAAKHFDMERLASQLPTVVTDSIAPVMVLADTLLWTAPNLRIASLADTEIWYHAFPYHVAEQVKADIADRAPDRHFNQRCWDATDWFTMRNVTPERLKELTNKASENPDAPLTLINALGHSVTMLETYQKALNNPVAVQKADMPAYFRVIGSQAAERRRMEEVVNDHNNYFIQDMVSGQEDAVIRARLNRYKATGIYADYARIPVTDGEFRKLTNWLKSKHDSLDGLRRAVALEWEIDADWSMMHIEHPSFDIGDVNTREVTKAKFIETLELGTVAHIRLMLDRMTLPLNILTKAVQGTSGELAKIFRPGILGYMDKPDWMAINFQDGISTSGLITALDGFNKMGPNKVLSAYDGVDGTGVVHGLAISKVRFHKSRVNGDLMFQLYSHDATLHGIATSKYYGTYLFAHMFDQEKCAGLTDGLAAYSCSLKVEREAEAPVAGFMAYRHDFRVLVTYGSGVQEILHVLG